ncbi:MAG: hypothetical protein ABI377_07115, partial [Devosia sp.]
VPPPAAPPAPAATPAAAPVADAPAAAPSSSAITPASPAPPPPPAPPPAAAAAPAGPPPSFINADTDLDAKISFAEAQKVWPKLTQAQFDAADTDHSGSLSADEYNALAKKPPAM